MLAPDGPPKLDWQRRVAADPRWAGAMAPVAILAATFLAYIPALALGFVFDDYVLIVTNDSIRSWHYFPSYFTSHIWSFRYPHLASNAYRPFYLLCLRLNDLLFGQHAWGWHLSLVVAHVAVTYLVYQLCLRLTRDGWVAAAGALVFGLHPVHVETIAEAAWADQPLSTFFILAAMLAFCRSREGAPRLDAIPAAWHGHPARERSWPGWPWHMGWHMGWLAAALALTAAALLSKESGLITPILVSGYVWIYGGAGGREVVPVESPGGTLARLRSALGAAVPFWAVLLLYAPLRIRALKGFTHVVTPLPLSKEILTLPSVLLFYLRLLVWPAGLSCYYDTPYISRLSLRDFVLPTALLAAIAATLACWYLWTRHASPREAQAIAFAYLWMALTILPVLNFRLLPENEIAHDRYIYLASVGFALLVAIVLRQARQRAGKSLNRPVWSRLGALLLALAMGWATASQCLYWADDLTLNFRAHQIAPHNVSATTSLAAAVAERGMEGAAMALYQQALAIRPDFWRANVNLAYIYYAHGDFPEAARFFARACTANPTDGDQFLYLGMALLRMGRLSEAEAASRTALLVRPQGKNYHLGLGMVLKAEGKLPEAKQEIAAQLSENGENAQARSLLEEITRQEQAAAEKWSEERPTDVHHGGIK